MIRFLIALLICSSTVKAQSIKLEGAEIKSLLSGNTAVGVRDGVQYRQYFALNGNTSLRTNGGSLMLGKWRVKAAELQSQIPSGASWRGWFVMEYAGDWFWVSKTTPPTIFQVIEGKKLGIN